MSLYEKKEYIKQMSWSPILMIILFAIVFFCSFAVPALKDTYGTQLLVSTQSSY